MPLTGVTPLGYIVLANPKGGYEMSDNKKLNTKVSRFEYATCPICGKGDDNTPTVLISHGEMEYDSKFNRLSVVVLEAHQRCVDKEGGVNGKA